MIACMQGNKRERGNKAILRIIYQGKVVWRNEKYCQGAVSQVMDLSNEEGRRTREDTPVIPKTMDTVDETVEQIPIPATEIPSGGAVEVATGPPGDFLPELFDQWLDEIGEEDNEFLFL